MNIDHTETDLNKSILHIYGHFQVPEESRIVIHDENVAEKFRTILETKTLAAFIGYGLITFDVLCYNLLKWIHACHG